MELAFDDAGPNACVACTGQAGECAGAYCARTMDTGSTGFCAADCSHLPCKEEGSACMGALDLSAFASTAACAPLFGCLSPSSAYPCTSRLALDGGTDVAFVAADDGDHAAVLRAVRPIVGVQCVGPFGPDDQIGDLAVLSTTAAGSEVVVTDVDWRSVQFSDDGAWLVYIDGVVDLCAGTGDLKVAKADGSEPRVVATKQSDDTFFVVGDYVAFWRADGSGGCSIDAAPLGGGDPVNVVTSPNCYPGRNIFDNAIPDPAGSAFLFSENQVIRNPGSAPYFQQTGAVLLARLAAGTVDALDTQPDHGLNGYSNGVTWSPDGATVALAGGGHVTLAHIDGAVADIHADCTCSAVAYSPDSTLVAWDAPANSGQTIASAVVVQSVAGGAPEVYPGIPGSGLDSLAISGDLGHVVAVRTSMLLAAPRIAGAAFATIVDNVNLGYSLSPLGGFVAAMAPFQAEIDVYPLDGGAPTVAIEQGGELGVALDLEYGFGGRGASSLLLATGSANATGVRFVALAKDDGSPAGLAVNLGASAYEPLWDVSARWAGHVLLVPVAAAFDGSSVTSWDIAALADDGSAGGTLARAVTAAAPAGGRLFYLRGDAPGLWTVPIPQP